MVEPEDRDEDKQELITVIGLVVWPLIVAFLILVLFWWLSGTSPKPLDVDLESERGHWSPGELRTLVAS